MTPPKTIEVRRSPGWHPKRQPWQFLVRQNGELMALGYARSREAAQAAAEVAHKYLPGNHSGRQKESEVTTS